MPVIMRILRSFVAMVAFLALAFAPALHAQSSNTAAWQLTTTPGGRQVASIRSVGPVRGLSLACQGSAPMVVIAASLSGAPARINLELTGTVDGSTITVPMTLNPNTGAYWAMLKDRTALDLLAGASSSVFLAANGAGLGTISLTGSSNAIRAALAGCYVPPAAPVASAGSTGASGAVHSLPLRFGTYVRAGKKCGADEGAQVFIDAGTGGAGYPGAGNFIKSLRKTGADTYVAREDVGVQDTSVITATYTIRDREHFTVKPQGEPAGTYSYCPLESLPLDQQIWPQSEHKEVASLPIKPGYYQALEFELTCPGVCAYYLFQNDGIAIAYPASENGPGSRHVLRMPRITQTGALGYSVRSRTDENDGMDLEIRSPTDFIEPNDMMGDTGFRPIDPKKIPAKLMPRF